MLVNSTGGGTWDIYPYAPIQVAVGSGNASGFVGTVRVMPPQYGGSASIVIDDSQDTQPNTFVLSNTTIPGYSSYPAGSVLMNQNQAEIDYVYSAVTNLTVKAGAGTSAQPNQFMVDATGDVTNLVGNGPASLTIGDGSIDSQIQGTLYIDNTAPMARTSP